MVIDSNSSYTRKQLSQIGQLSKESGEEGDFLVVSVIDELREYWMRREGRKWVLDHTWKQVWLRDH